eukprot:g15172.t1
MDTAFVAARAAQSTRSSPELTAAFRAEQPGRGRAAVRALPRRARRQLRKKSQVLRFATNVFERSSLEAGAKLLEEAVKAQNSTSPTESLG